MLVVEQNQPYYVGTIQATMVSMQGIDSLLILYCSVPGHGQHRHHGIHQVQVRLHQVWDFQQVDLSHYDA